MGILGSLLMSPVLGPIDGVLWLARTIEDQANAERWDEGKVIGGLAELEIDSIPFPGPERVGTFGRLGDMFGR